jgi:Tfp pilus assembly protein PilO
MTPKRYYYALLGILIVGSLAAVSGYYWQTTQLNAHSAQVKAELTKSALADERIEQLNSLKYQFRELSPLAVKLENALPRDKRQSQILLQIQQIAASSGMSVANVSFLNSNSLPTATSQAVRVKDYFAIPISFQLSGNYPQLQAFLQRLESLERFTTVNSLAINQGGTRSLTFTVNLSTFFKP